MTDWYVSTAVALDEQACYRCGSAIPARETHWLIGGRVVCTACPTREETAEQGLPSTFSFGMDAVHTAADVAFVRRLILSWREDADRFSDPETVRAHLRSCQTLAESVTARAVELGLEEP